MASKRPERVAGLVHREVTDILARRLRDPRFARVTVIDVEVTGDLKYARVFVSTLETGPERERLLAALRRAAPAARRELAPRLNLREVPELRFEFDDSLERGARVEELLRRIHRGESIEEEDES